MIFCSARCRFTSIAFMRALIRRSIMTRRRWWGESTMRRSRMGDIPLQSTFCRESPYTASGLGLWGKLISTTRRKERLWSAKQKSKKSGPAMLRRYTRSTFAFRKWATRWNGSLCTALRITSAIPSPSPKNASRKTLPDSWGRSARLISGNTSAIAVQSAPTRFMEF